MTIWALKGPSKNDYEEGDYQEVTQFLSDSIISGTSRFGWGYMDNADLNYLVNLEYQNMSDKEKQCWGRASFLLNVEVGDWVVHINLPYWGACLAGKVISKYEFETVDNKLSDFRHMLKLDSDSIIEFERNDDAVLPNISSRLKLQGSYWRIYQEDDFLQTIDNLKSENLGKKENESVGLFYLKKELTPFLNAITEKIHKTHPGSKLEELIAEVFNRIPNIISVYENGKYKGWGTDNGADLLVTYKAGLSIANLEKEEKLVVQIKSYEGQHWETNAVSQIETALTVYEANAGLIISTAEPTKALYEAIEDLSKKINKPIGLIAGEEVSKFVFKYGSDLVF